MIPIYHFLILSAFLLCVGIVVVLTKKNGIVILMGIELIFNAANINLIAFSQYDPSLVQGQVFTLFVMIVAAAEVAVAMAIILQVYQYYQTSDLDEVNELKG